MANKGEIGKRMVECRRSLRHKWAELRFGEAKVETVGDQHVFEVRICLSDIDSSTVRVELYAEGVTGCATVRQEMKRAHQLADSGGDYVYKASVPASRPSADYTARVIPNCDGFAVPLEEARILWQR